jgi:hypothetical protein
MGEEMKTVEERDKDSRGGGMKKVKGEDGDN